MICLLGYVFFKQVVFLSCKVIKYHRRHYILSQGIHNRYDLQQDGEALMRARGMFYHGKRWTQRETDSSSSKH